MKLKFILNENILLGFSERKLVIHNRKTRMTTFRTNFDDILWEKNSLLGKVFFVNDRLLFSPDHKCLFIDQFTGEKIDAYPIHYNGHNKEILIGTQMKDNIRYTCGYDYRKNEYLWEKPCIISSVNFLDDNSCYLLQFDENYKLMPVVFRFNIYSGETLWQFSLSTLPSYKDIWGKEKPAEVIQILGIYENVLWVHIANFRLIGIDVKNGELLHYFDNLLKGKSENVFLDDLSGRIRILSYDYYGEFDLKTLSFIKEETVQCIDDVKIRASNFIKGDKNLYFCGYYNQSLHPNAFGIFDTEKAEIVWYETTNDDLGYFYNPPQASEKLLAILDDKQNLLIYERD